MAVAATSTPVTKKPSGTIPNPGILAFVPYFFRRAPAKGNNIIFQPRLMITRSTRDCFQFLLWKKMLCKQECHEGVDE